MQKLRIHYLQHVPFEGPGYIAEWADDKGHTLSATHLFDTGSLPATTDFDWLVIMGGPMGVYDEEAYPWLREEKAFIRSAINAGKTIVGICLGSQLLAEALGALVYRNPQKEIGWFPVSLTADAKEHRLLAGLADSFPVFHWHGDTFDLPRGATHLLSTIACKNQAFSYGNNILGLQFHLEATPETLHEMVDHGQAELKEAGQYIQSGAAMLQQAALIVGTNNILATILDRLAASPSINEK